MQQHIWLHADNDKLTIITNKKKFSIPIPKDWIHLGIVEESSVQKIYVDGVDINAEDYTPPGNAGNDPTWLPGQDLDDDEPGQEVLA